MRKFLVYYRRHLIYGEYEYYTKIFVLNAGEKANDETFASKLNELGIWQKEILSWSLIEE
jgi:hypothetical protein